MKIVCSWCRHEGKSEFVGEKPPFDDTRETHGICVVHRDQVQAHWRASERQTVDPQNRKGLSSALLQWKGLLDLNRRKTPQ